MMKRKNLIDRWAQCLITMSFLSSSACQFWGQEYSPCLDDTGSEQCIEFSESADAVPGAQGIGSELDSESPPDQSQVSDPTSIVEGPEPENPNPEMGSEGISPNPGEIDDSGEAILSINEITIGILAYVEVFNGGTKTADSGSFDIVTDQGDFNVNRRCTSSFSLPANQVMVFVLGDEACDDAPVGVPCQVCNFDLMPSNNQTLVYLYENASLELDRQEYPTIDNGGPGLGFSWSAFPDGASDFSVRKQSFGLCNDSSSSCIIPTEF